jgi:hypothetical protein
MHKSVNVKLQMLFSIIPILDLLASYRIQKLGYWILVMYLGFGIAAYILNFLLFESHWCNRIECTDFLIPQEWTYSWITFGSIQVGTGLYLIRRWSISWNNQLS